MNLHNYDIVIINSSGGKDSICAIWQICQMAHSQNYDKSKIHVSHQDLGEAEWKGTTELVKKQADIFGLKLHVSKRRNKDGYEESLLEYVERRGKWPSSQQRWCTSDFKRVPGCRVVVALTKGLGKCKVLHVFGFRKEESPARAKKQVLKINKKLTTKKRTVYDYLPIHKWSKTKVWRVIRDNGIPYPKSYILGIPRYSCVFCIFSPFDALVLAGMENLELLDKYVYIEDKTGHSFRPDFTIRSVKEAIEKGHKPKGVKDWVM